jgi:hypothetical protein|tara:strand:- start:637 stop:837 length:201 start_codon:yes stop_codon:yes gene_type:complete
VSASPQIPRLLTKSHESGQFDLVLETILKGIRNVIAGLKLRRNQGMYGRGQRDPRGWLPRKCLRLP